MSSSRIYVGVDGENVSVIRTSGDRPIPIIGLRDRVLIPVTAHLLMTEYSMITMRQIERIRELLGLDEILRIYPAKAMVEGDSPHPQIDVVFHRIRPNGEPQIIQASGTVRTSVIGKNFKLLDVVVCQMVGRMARRVAETALIKDMKL